MSGTAGTGGSAGTAPPTGVAATGTGTGGTASTRGAGTAAAACVTGAAGASCAIGAASTGGATGTASPTGGGAATLAASGAAGSAGAGGGATLAAFVSGAGAGALSTGAGAGALSTGAGTGALSPGAEAGMALPGQRGGYRGHGCTDWRSGRHDRDSSGGRRRHHGGRIDHWCGRGRRCRGQRILDDRRCGALQRLLNVGRRGGDLLRNLQARHARARRRCWSAVATGTAPNMPAVTTMAIPRRFTFRTRPSTLLVVDVRTDLTCCRVKQSERLWNRCQGEALR